MRRLGYGDPVPRSPFTPPDLTSDRARALELIPVSRETLRRLDRLVEVLMEGQARMNLIAPSTIPHIWTRHIADSLQLVALAPAARRWIDLGSGAGFPGLVIACALADEAGTAVHLVESIGKKAAFLREAAQATGAPATIHQERIEDFVDRFRDDADIVTARALAPLKDLLPWARPFLRRGALALFPKGQHVEVELTEASKYWNIKGLKLIPSRTDPHARIIMIAGVEPNPPRA
jgi:16S rRNA (guanine527-N7)-methyltransferase